MKSGEKNNQKENGNKEKETQYISLRKSSWISKIIDGTKTIEKDEKQTSANVEKKINVEKSQSHRPLHLALKDHQTERQWGLSPMILNGTV